MEKHPLQIKTPELQKSDEVQDAVEKQERLTGEKIPNDPNERIDTYMDRLENVFLHPDGKTRQRNLEMLRPKIYDALLIKPKNFPESFFELQKRVAREQGHGDVEITPEMRERMIETSIEDQKHSLDAWINYLTSDDAVYPTWFKYYAWTQITKLSQFDKERGEFKKRTDKTVAPFPDIYREPLAQLCDLYEKVKEDNKALKDEEIREIFSKKFPSAYAELIQKSLATQIEKKEGVEGEWVKYEQGDMGQAEKLFNSLESKGTGWCTAGKSTAETQIKSGDFYVFYTNDEHGQPTQPRLAIRMNGKNKIGEVRGILPHQNVEPIVQEVLNNKLEEFGPEADQYRKKNEDMRHLTELKYKQEKGEAFTEEDLLFVYEVDSKIEGFGYQRDPRIKELVDGRNFEEDTIKLSQYILDNRERFSDSSQKKAEDTLKLNEVASKETLTATDLRFLYEIDRPIQGFGAIKDPRIADLRSGRDKYKDAYTLAEKIGEMENKVKNKIRLTKDEIEYLYELNNNKIEDFFGVPDYRIGWLFDKVNPKNYLDVMFECTKDEIARKLSEINENTKAYVGELTPAVLLRLPDTVTHIRDAYPAYAHHDRSSSTVTPFLEENYVSALPNARRFLALQDKIKNKEQLNRNDLLALYEVDAHTGFFEEDEEKLRKFKYERRANLEGDMAVIFECSKDQIAHNNQEINENTKAYIGDLESDVLQKLPEAVEYIYTSFPNDRVRREKILVGGKSPEQLINELEASHFNVTEDAKLFMKTLGSKSAGAPQEMTAVTISARSLKIYWSEFTSFPHVSEVLSRARNLGLDSCPPEIAPYYRLRSKNPKDLTLVYMKPMRNSKNEEQVFYIGNNDRSGVPSLSTRHLELSADWYAYLFVFRK